MSSRAIESSFCWVRIYQAISVREMSSFSMTSLFRVPGAGLSRHASNIKKISHKDKGKWWANYQINVVLTSCRLQ